MTWNDRLKIPCSSPTLVAQQRSVRAGFAAKQLWPGSILHRGSARVFLLAMTLAVQPAVARQSCGTLNVDSAVASHCFPQDGSHHSVCCVDIELSDDPSTFNALERLISLASKPESYSWCTCSADICEKLGGSISPSSYPIDVRVLTVLTGKVAWDATPSIDGQKEEAAGTK
eukprot:1990730-Rhodomonas_salina.1